MIAATLARNETNKPLLKLQKSLPLCLVPVRLKVPPHHQTVLEVWQYNDPFNNKIPAIKNLISRPSVVNYIVTRGSPNP
jgi:hypothetical protein